MAKLRVHNVALSLDGFMAGPEQSLEYPIGIGGPKLHDWVFATRAGREMIGQDGGTEELDNQFLLEGQQGIGATIMGRNMFGPVRGAWPNDDWTGWWGEEPPFHHPVFVLTHHQRPSLMMQGGTTFHFVDDPIESVLERAFEAADGADVRLGGGASTIQQYLRAQLVDEMHLAIVPILVGSGERLFDDSGIAVDAYECTELLTSPSVVHARFAKVARGTV